MIITPKCIINSQAVTTSDATKYTAPINTTTIIDKFTATNTGGSSQTLNVNIFTSGASVGIANLIIDGLSIAAGATVDITALQNQILNSGDKLSAKGSSTDIVIRGSAREVST